MKVKDKFSETNLFEEINKVSPFPFVDVFPVDRLQQFYLLCHGEKPLNNTGRKASVEELAKIISGLYSENWKRIYDSIIPDFPILESYVETVTEETEENGKNEMQGKTENKNTVSAYNDDDFVNNDATETENESKEEKESKTHLIRETRRTENATENLKNALNYLQNNVIYFIIFNDVNNVITKSIYY